MKSQSPAMSTPYFYLFALNLANNHFRKINEFSMSNDAGSCTFRNDAENQENLMEIQTKSL